MMQLQLQLKKVLDSGMCCFTLQKLFHLHLIAPGKSQLQLQFSEQNKGKTSKEAARAQSSFSEPTQRNRPRFCSGTKHLSTEILISRFSTLDSGERHRDTQRSHN